MSSLAGGAHDPNLNDAATLKQKPEWNEFRNIIWLEPFVDSAVEQWINEIEDAFLVQSFDGNIIGPGSLRENGEGRALGGPKCSHYHDI